MKNGWPMVPLGEVLKLQRRWIKPDPFTDYGEIGVRSFGNGIFHKSPVSGASLGDKRVLRIEPGDLVFMNVFAWEGAVAVAGPDVAGKIGSHRFATYTPVGDRVDVRFLNFYFKTRDGRELLGRISPGSALRNRTMNLSQFAEQRVPLPPLPEQRRIVARIESLAAKIAEARSNQGSIAEECEQLCRSPLFDASANNRLTPMRELVERRPSDISVQASQSYDFAGIYCFGGGMFKSGRKSGMDFAYKQLTTVHTNDFVYPKLMAWEGALTTVPPECDGLVVSPEFPVFRVQEDRVLPEVLDAYFKTPAVWPSLSGSSIGTNVRRKRLNPDDFLAIQFPLPSMSVQKRVRECKQKTAALKQHQDQSAAELDALLPSILDRAFRGDF
jgi:type I restriction enzyme, S subunit